MLRKTKLLSLMALTLAFASCERDMSDLDSAAQDPTSGAITFAAQIASRATDTAFVESDEISVTAYKTDGSVAHDDVKHTYGSDGLFVADEGQSITYSSTNPSYSFFAVYPYAAGVSYSGKTFDFTVDTDQSAGYTDSDLMYATLGESSENTRTLQFSHLLTKLSVVITDERAAAEDDAVSSVKVTAMTAASVDLSGATSSISTATTSGQITMEAIGSTYSAIVMPQTLGGTITYTSADAFVITTGSETYYFTCPSTELKSGSSYSIGVTLRDGDIVVSGISLSGWTDGSSAFGSSVFVGAPVPDWDTMTSTTVTVSSTIELYVDGLTILSAGFRQGTSDIDWESTLTLLEADSVCLNANGTYTAYVYRDAHSAGQNANYRAYAVTEDTAGNISYYQSENGQFNQASALPTPTISVAVDESLTSTSSFTVTATVDSYSGTEAIVYGLGIKSSSDEDYFYTDPVKVATGSSYTQEFSGLTEATSYSVVAYSIVTRDNGLEESTVYTTAITAKTSDSGGEAYILLSEILEDDYPAQTTWKICLDSGNLEFAKLGGDVTPVDDATADDFATLRAVLQQKSGLSLEFLDLGVVPDGALQMTTFDTGVVTTASNAVTELSLPVATTIGKAAFAGLTYLDSVYAPKVVTLTDSDILLAAGTDGSANTAKAAKYIVNGAFYGCSSLSTISLPLVEHVGHGSFNGCTALSSISIPEATYIGQLAFGSTIITELILPNVTELAESVAGDASNANNVANGPFSTMGSLTNISIPGVTAITRGAFQACTYLQTATISPYASIGYRAFQGCNNLTGFTYDDSVYGATEWAAAGSPTIYIGNGAFIHAWSMPSFYHPYATIVEQNVFQSSSANALVEIILPEVTTMACSQNNSAATHSALTLLYLPKLESVANGANFFGTRASGFVMVIGTEATIKGLGVAEAGTILPSVEGCTIYTKLAATAADVLTTGGIYLDGTTASYGYYSTAGAAGGVSARTESGSPVLSSTVATESMLSTIVNDDGTVAATLVSGYISTSSNKQTSSVE